MASAISDDQNTYLYVVDYVSKSVYNTTIGDGMFTTNGVTIADDPWTVVAISPNDDEAHLIIVDVESGNTKVMWTIADPDKLYGYGYLLFSDPYLFLLTPCVNGFYPNVTTQTLLIFDTTQQPWAAVNTTISLDSVHVCYYMPIFYDEENGLFLQSGDTAWTGFTALIEDPFDSDPFVSMEGNAFPMGMIAFPPYTFEPNTNVLYSLATIYPPDRTGMFEYWIASQDGTTKTTTLMSLDTNIYIPQTFGAVLPMD